MVYNEIRGLFGLSANLAVCAGARVGANRKTAKQKDTKVVCQRRSASAICQSRHFSQRRLIVILEFYHLEKKTGLYPDNPKKQNRYPESIGNNTEDN
ncbi:hypothetical protein [Nostoc sp.]|uniref:hypothetical protein n=1 Tax=Nostoc sp. TaxID=1180 RepID=UPI002FF7C641